MKWGKGIGACGATVAAFFAIATSAGAAVLVNQVPNGSFSVQSAFAMNIPANQFDSRAADDFTVPQGQVWTIQALDMFGFAQGTTPNIDAVNVELYATGGSGPAAGLFSQSGISPGRGNCVAGQCDFTAPLSNAPALPPGQYWISGQAVMDTGQWRWAVNPPQFSHGLPAVWENPGDGFGAGCPTYRPLLDCGVITAEAGRDLYLILDGTVIDSRFTLAGFESNGNRISLRANFPAAGSVAVKGKKLKKVTKNVGAGSAKLPIKLTGGAKRKLARGRNVKLAPKITFTATGGVPFALVAKVKVIPARAGLGAPSLRLAE